jgi:hypothetical protein
VLADIQVVMLSNSAESENETAMRNQAEAYFIKASMSLVDLVDRVEAVIRARRVA